jgi:hypothetical protein
MKRCKGVQVLFRVANDKFERTYLVISMFLIVADTTDDTILKTLGFQADEVKHFSGMEVALAALWVVKFSRHLDIVI